MLDIKLSPPDEAVVALKPTPDHAGRGDPRGCGHEALRAGPPSSGRGGRARGRSLAWSSSPAGADYGIATFKLSAEELAEDLGACVRWISNTSPSTVPLSSRVLDLLLALYGTIVVPSGAVARARRRAARGHRLSRSGPTSHGYRSARSLIQRFYGSLPTSIVASERFLRWLGKRADPLTILDDGLARHAKRGCWTFRSPGRWESS